MTDDIKITPAILGAIEVFRNLSLADYESLAHILKAQSYKPNQHIITLGEDTRDVFFIISGTNHKSLGFHKRPDVTVITISS